MDNQAKSRCIRKTAFVTVVAAVAVFYLAALAAADAPQQGQWPCAEDFAKYCADIQPGVGRIAKCLKEHENDMSAACREHIAQVKQRSREVKEACEGDTLKFCKDVQPGKGRIMRCLMEHDGELSTACREKLPKGKRGN